MIRTIQIKETDESRKLEQRLLTDPKLKESLDNLNLFLETGNYKYIRKPIESKKVGRNDPCNCGSGKKYKKCHGK